MLWGKSIELGHDKEQDDLVYITPKIRSTHMHILGSTGEGKSKFIEHMIREDIKHENGLCLIDPHGYLYQDIVRWCAAKQMFGRKNIILFDAGEDDWSFGFNPLRIGSAHISYHVDAMVRAVAKVWGGQDLDRTPLLKRCLRLIFHVLAEKKLSLLECRYLLDHTHGLVREYLTRDIQDPNIQPLWDYANSLKPTQFEEQFSSTINRMLEFLASPIIRNTIGQTEATLNFRKLMDEGGILLVNLAARNRISDDNARLLGTLIVNDLFMACREREEGSRPFYLYIDECARFINEDIGRILDEARKFGLHLILAHQHLAQLKKAGEDIYHSVMTDAKTKVIFGGLGVEDAELLTQQVFLGSLDLEEAKHTLDKPTVVRYIRAWMENYSRGISSSRTETKGTTEQDGHSEGSSQSETRRPKDGWFFDDDELVSTNSGRSSSRSWSRSESKSEAFTEGESESWGKSQTLEPILKLLPTSVFSLQEQIYKAMSAMVNQPTQYAIIKLPKKIPRFVKTPSVKKAFAFEEEIKAFKENCYHQTEFAKQRLEVEEGIKYRMLAIEKAAYLHSQEQAKIAAGKASAARRARTVEARHAKKDPESFRE